MTDATQTDHSQPDHSRPDPRQTDVPVPEDDTSRHPTVAETDRRFDDAGDQPILRTETGLCIPRLGFGTWQLEGDNCQAMVERAIEIGVRHIDTAQMYANEDRVGAALAASGIAEEIFVTTKISNDHHEPDDLVQSMHESLDRLGLERVDLVLVHWPTDWERIGATMAALAAVHAAGRTRHIGLSNFTIEQLDSMSDAAPVEVLQVECHPYLQQHELRAWCRKNGWAFTAYSPLAQGDVLDDEVMRSIADAHGATPTQIALAWLLHLEGVVAIPRTSDAAHLESNWAARSIELTDEEIDRIAGLDDGRRLVDPDFSPF